MGMYNLPNYATGGTIHIVVNNQIGFTTDPRFARSTPYPSDIAKSIDAPIFHVNGDDVEAVTFVHQLAADWRAKFKKDVVIDLVCYRRHGHNETDQPSFTQPRMYEAISNQETTLTQYSKQLVEEGSFTQKDIDEHKKWILDHKDTGVDVETLKHVGRTISSYPDDFEVHRNLSRILKTRLKTIDEGKGIDMSTAEALAFGTLCMEKVLCPCTICRVQLELVRVGCLGFELGFSLVDPHNLTIWEAQFGDFANNAQCIIDQFIASQERKWLARSGLVLNLPHGYDGQGPEHSSGRPERFLQLVDDNPFVYPPPEKMERQHQDGNMAVVYPSIPSNVFHVLRRQVHRDFRKPLIHFFSKSLLRHPEARSTLKDMEPGSGFIRFIPEPHHTEGQDALVPPEEIKRHIICTGQHYYALLKHRRENKIDNVAISRMEQIAPFPFDDVRKAIDTYPTRPSASAKKSL
ncbi:hypothetical protein L7F22_007845 [Adiantum nelumboides]|nr:hypothetical protein [Adiantum nelumboides]